MEYNVQHGLPLTTRIAPDIYMVIEIAVALHVFDNVVDFILNLSFRLAALH